MQNAYDSINAALSVRVNNFKSTDNTISPQIVPLIFTFFKNQINEIATKENLTLNDFPSMKFDYQNNFKPYEDEELIKQYKSHSSYITFFTQPVHNFIIAEVVNRGDKDLDYKIVPTFGESDYFLFYYDNNFKIKYTYSITVHNN
jgi:hypothetical protein